MSFEAYKDLATALRLKRAVLLHSTVRIAVGRRQKCKEIRA